MMAPVWREKGMWPWNVEERGALAGMGSVEYVGSAVRGFGCDAILRDDVFLEARLEDIAWEGRLDVILLLRWWQNVGENAHRDEWPCQS